MLPADTPKLAKWPFLLGDAALLALAWLIGDRSRTPFAGTPLIAIVACVLCGAIIAAVPFLADYARKQDEALDERQRSLESLARTVAASAEQIGIAANGLHEIAELAQRNLKAAEQLPGKLQEKIAGLKIPSDSPRDAERDELKKELVRLRASEGERLQSAADKIAKAAVELSRLAARPERVEPARPELGSEEPDRNAATRPEPGSPGPSRSVDGVVPAAPPNVPAPTSEPVSAIAAETAPPPRRSRKPRSEEAVIHPAPVVPDPSFEEPPPIPAAAIPEVVPVAPGSTPPIETNRTELSAPAPAVSEAPSPKPERRRSPKKPRPDSPIAGISAPEHPPSQISNPESNESPLGLAESPANPEPVERAAIARAAVERAVSSDGATRLLVTAYIGIGNRLFIRGTGPGLSWDKGLPLQFVSIGKWRWETSDATAPVQFKLYKNDDNECAALGTQTLDPGQQEEVTATF